MVIRIEKWRDGKLRVVERDDKGRFVSIKPYVPPPPRPPPKPILWKAIRYDVRFKVAYLSDQRPSKNRLGAIAGKIYSSSELSENEIVNMIMDAVKEKYYDAWISHVEPNKIWDIHVYPEVVETEREIYGSEVSEVEFEDLRGW